MTTRHNRKYVNPLYIPVMQLFLGGALAQPTLTFLGIGFKVMAGSAAKADNLTVYTPANEHGSPIGTRPRLLSLLKVPRWASVSVFWGGRGLRKRSAEELKADASGKL